MLMKINMLYLVRKFYFSSSKITEIPNVLVIQLQLYPVYTICINRASTVAKSNYAGTPKQGIIPSQKPQLTVLIVFIFVTKIA